MTIQQQYQQTKVLTGPLNCGDAITMTSLDFLNNIINPARIAAGEAKVEHGKFLARVLDELDGEGVEKFSIPHPQNKQPIDVANLNMDHLTLVGMRESKAVRRSVLAKLKVLDEQVRAPHVDPMVALNDPATMRGLLLTYTEKVLVLEEQVEGMKPKVEALDLIATADGSLNLTEAAKALQQPPRKFNQFLCGLRWIYKRAGGKRWLGYQDKVQQGLLEHKVETITLADGSERLCEQVRITPKGLTKLAQQFCVGGVQ
ncbi:phage antirepressor KilAC domain-containing protein [Aeromonas caviae]|uniref:phage antirepressor KilAC domain-containing protein n=1 Tax=Aeromonas caviae TaxID=648 RepID=UPI0038CFBC1B